jgi:dihydropteroate synthase
VHFPSDRVTIVGILNTTPDSFSDGGRFADAGAAVDRGRVLRADGAHVVDVGGESTRPGARPVAADEERARVLPVIEALAPEMTVSVDTRKGEVAHAALEAGARVVNDVSGGRDPRLLEAAAKHGAALVLGHLRGEPAGMQEGIHFDAVLDEVGAELERSLERARRAGVEERVADPGIGFGKHLEHNLELVAGIGRLRRRLGVPVLLGVSRKAFLGALTGDPVETRDAASHAAAAIGVFAGADAVRVHDVAGARRAVAVAEALRGARAGTRGPAEGAA